MRQDLIAARAEAYRVGLSLRGNDPASLELASACGTVRHRVDLADACGVLVLLIGGAADPRVRRRARLDI